MPSIEDFRAKLIGPGPDDYGRATPAPLPGSVSYTVFDDSLAARMRRQSDALRAADDADIRRPLNKRSNASIADGELPPLCPEQQAALEVLCRADGIVKRLSGKAGTGKSTLIRYLQNRTPITICATTAKAALNAGGITLDRLFVYDREKDRCRNEDKLDLAMDGCEDIIVIDEASMLGRKMAVYIKSVCKRYGKTLILVGDWAQAKPVKDEWITKSTLLDNSITIFLVVCHRQKDKPFLDALDALSMGAKASPAYSVFDQCHVRREPDGDHYVRGYATNKLTDNYNRVRLAELDSTSPSLPIQAKATKHTGKWFPNEEDRIIDDSRFLHGISLKLGARLICTKNDYQHGFVNGDVGELIDVGFFTVPRGIKVLTLPPLPEGTTRPTEDSQGHEIVCWLSQIPRTIDQLDPVRSGDAILLLHHDRTGEQIQVHAHKRELTDIDDQPLQTVSGYPVKLGYSVTFHSCQGATYDHMYVDMKSIMNFPEGSRHGLAYVALSRCRTLEGLKIYGWDPAAIECDPEVWRLLAPPPPPPVVSV